MSKTINGNIWRLDKGIKRLEKSIADIDCGIALLHRNSISEDQYNRMKKDINVIADKNQEILRMLKEASDRWVYFYIVALVLLVPILSYLSMFLLKR